MKISELIEELQQLEKDEMTDVVLDFEDTDGSTEHYVKLSDYSLADVDYESFPDAEGIISLRLQKI
jgi:hypothetical protein